MRRRLAEVRNAEGVPAFPASRARAQADLFWAELVGDAALSTAVFEGAEADDVPSLDGRPPFFGDRPGETWRVIARPGSRLDALDLRGDDLIIRRRRTLFGRRQLLCELADDTDLRAIEGLGGRVRPGALVLRRASANGSNGRPVADQPPARRQRGGREDRRDPMAASLSEQNAAQPRYGGYLLQRGDDDALRTWGGRARAAGEVLPGADQPGFVRQLQEDLRTLGFAVVGTPNGRFDWQTEWALREFQHEADAPWVAQEQAPAAAPPARYVDRLTSVQATSSGLTPSTVCGWLSANDRTRIELWLQNRWRCPVVMEAWRSADLDASGQPRAGRLPQEQNIWHHTEPAQKRWRVLARDFSRRHDLGALGRDPTQMRVVGYRETTSKGGPQSVPPHHCWTEAEITPMSMTGRTLASLTPEELSTFKVVRAVSETECEGYLDSLNCWDNVILSAGPYHWPIGAPRWSATEPGWNEGGELGGFLAYLRQHEADAFLRLTDLALQPEKTWNPADATFFNRSQRRYASRLQWRTPARDSSFATVPLVPRDMSYFKSWHWVYRFQMAARTDPAYRRAMWGYARIRIRDLLATPWGAGLQVTGGAAPRPATIGDVFKSERNVAMLVRWHVRFPAHVVSGGNAAAPIRAVLAAAGLPAPDPATWGDREEGRLGDAIMASPQVPDTMPTVRDWPTWTAARNPNLFALDLSSLSVAERTLRADRGSYRLSAP